MTKNPSFPDFKKLELPDRSAIEAFTLRFDPYSDLNFTSLWCWDTESAVEWSVHDDNLIVKLPSYGADSRPRYTMLGESDPCAAAHRLLTDGTSSQSLDLVPEVVAECLKADDRFSVREDRDNADYVINIAQFLERAGGKYANMRQRIGSFRRRSPTVVDLDIGTNQARDFITRVSQEWFHNHATADDTIIREQKSESIAISRSTSIGSALRCLGVVLDGEPYAFSIYELVQPNWCISHFAKTARPLTGATFFEVDAVLSRCLADGAEHCNFEQDLGLPGLRTSKLRHRPSHFLRKYTIRLVE